MVSAELLAEEIAARSDRIYEWNDDQTTAVVQLVSGAVIRITGNESDRVVVVNLNWSRSGKQEHKRVGKWMAPAADRCVKELKASGWQIKTKNIQPPQSMVLEATLAVRWAASTLTKTGACLLKSDHGTEFRIARETCGERALAGGASRWGALGVRVAMERNLGVFRDHVLILCVTALAPWMLPTPRLVVLGGEPGNRFGSRTHVARERPEVSMAGFRHEQGCRDAVLAQMGQRTVAQLVKGPLPSRCFTEQKTTPAGRTAAPGRRGFDPARPERRWADLRSQRSDGGGDRPGSGVGAVPSPAPSKPRYGRGGLYIAR